MRHGHQGCQVENGLKGDQVEIGSQVEKRRPGIKMAEKGPKNFSRFMRHGTRGGQADNGQKGSQE